MSGGMGPTVEECREAEEREAFEERAYSRYFISTIGRAPNGFMVSGATMDKRTFCERDETGAYRIQTLDAAWWAWQERAKRDTRA